MRAYKPYRKYVDAVAAVVLLCKQDEANERRKKT